MGSFNNHISQMNRAAAILTKMKRSEQKQIRDDERRILDALRSSGACPKEP